ncbi:hypothetical protein ACIQUS_04280 [Pseudomonas sp. NPDC090755]|uniref:hypothetical protein n=1 Tax=Pseudomonas sp. NPDC090755 TaxID=3364481 RepID=UPI00383AB2F5
MQIQNINVVHDGQSYVGFEFAALPLLAALRVACQTIDQVADQARLSVLSDPLRALEYQTAAQEAQAFAASGYIGDAPPSVQAWMDAADLEARPAADSILAEAIAWQGAMYAIRAARLKGKQAVLKATTHAAAEHLADEAVAAIRASVVGVGNA